MNDPRLNKWYYDEDAGQRFEIIDLKDDYIVVQGLDGSVSEYSIEEWGDRQFTSIAPPESWDLSWGLEALSEDHEDRFESSKRNMRPHKEDEAEDIDDFSFSEDLEDSQDFDGH